jgi:molybdopterin-guanine dinucleotide biosynthesis protein A
VHLGRSHPRGERSTLRPVRLSAVGFDAVILAGGASRRMGGIDKASIDVGGKSLLDRAVDAVAAADRVVAVGPQRRTAPRLLWTQEQPPGGGPVAALARGLTGVTNEVTVVLAVDQPFVDRATVTTLVEAIGDGEGAILVDSAGTDQPLVGAYRTGALRAAFETLGGAPGGSMRGLVARLALTRLESDGARDCDTWEDVAAARRVLVK